MFSSLMTLWFQLILVNSTVGFRAAFSWSMFGAMCPGSTMKLSPLLCASWLSSCHCVSSSVHWMSCHGSSLDSQPVLCHSVFNVVTISPSSLLLSTVKTISRFKLYRTADLDVFTVESKKVLSRCVLSGVWEGSLLISLEEMLKGLFEFFIVFVFCS